jgi:lactoylglutathione lyase
MTTAFTMTKLVVADLEAASAFYTAVCGLAVVDRIEGPTFAEVIMRSSARGSATLILITYRGEAARAPGECVLVFETDDAAGFVDRAIAAGGRVTQPPQHLPEMGLTFAMVTDPEGHVVEALQRHPAAS